MPIHKRTLALTQLILLLPSLLFMVALLARSLTPLSTSAQSIVAWYAGRIWTLWLFLVLLPLAALLTGGLTLLTGRRTSITAPAARLQPASFLITALTLVAALLLAVVAVHMLMN